MGSTLSADHGAPQPALEGLPVTHGAGVRVRQQFTQQSWTPGGGVQSLSARLDLPTDERAVRGAASTVSTAPLSNQSAGYQNAGEET